MINALANIQPAVHGGARFDPSAAAYFAARTSLSAPQKKAINTFVKGLKTAGIWPKISDAMILMGGSFSDCMVKLKGTSTATNHGFTSANYLGSGGAAGLLGDGSSTIDTGFNISTQSENDTHLGALVRSNWRVFGGYTGYDSGSGTRFGLVTINADPPLIQAFANVYGGQVQANVSYQAFGFTLQSRTNSTTFKAWQNGNLLGTNTGANTYALPNSNMILYKDLADNAVGSDRLAYYSCGAGLSDTDAANYNTLVLQLEDAMTTRGLGNFLWTTWPFNPSPQATPNLAVLKSLDALGWAEIPNVSVTYDSSDTSAADYSIFKHTDGNYYAAYTRSQTSATTAGLLVSADLVTWAPLTPVDFSGVSGTNLVWGPEWFVDPADGSVNLLAAVSSSGSSGPFSVALLTLSGASLATRTGAALLNYTAVNEIDPFMVVRNGAYLLACRQQGAGIKVLQATSLRGAYTQLQAPNFLGFGGDGYEAPQPLIVDGEERFYFDSFYNGAGTCYVKQTSGDWTTGTSAWSGIITLPTPFICRHGTILAL